MKELKAKLVYSTPGFMDKLEIKAYQLQPGDNTDIEMQDGITKDQFHAILDKASQPIKKDKSKE